MRMNTQTIIFIGPQGSGKGTQVANLIAFLKEQDTAKPVVEIQTGRGFRALAEGATYTSDRVRDLIEHGNLIPDFLTEAIVATQLRDELTPEAHIVCDGFPRNVSQAKYLDAILSFYLREELTIVHLDADEKTVTERMQARGRADDTPEGIAERLRLYHALTEPVLEYYKAHSGAVIHDIDASKDIETVFAEIQEKLALV